MSRLIIVDDDVQTCQLLSDTTSHLFSKVETFNDALAFLRQPLTPEDIVLLDLKMPNLDGVETIRRLAKNHCQASLVLMSGYDAGVLSSAEELARDQGLTVFDNLTKPIGIGHLNGVLSQLLSKQQKHQSTAIKQISKNCHEPKPAPAFQPTEADLRHAMARHQLVLHYQPQMDLKTNQLAGVEALMRWQHPEHGLIYPDRFVPLAQQSGLIGDLTERVIDLVIEQSARWQQQGRPIKISVNISADNITSLSLPEQLKSQVRLNKLDPAMLVLEVTESVLMGELTTSLDILTRLRLKGFQLSIDDFGTGFSSLSLLHRMPFTELKIDKSFVMKISTDPQSRAIVETCIMLGHKLNMTVVAEGIENEFALKWLKEMHCDVGQGYTIGKPVTADELSLGVCQNLLAEQHQGVSECVQ